MTKAAPLPSVSEIHRCFQYDASVGTLRWRIAPANRVRAGDISGTTTPAGYRAVRIGGAIHMAHRVIWKMMTGSDPTGEIDHVDGDPSNNRWCNLRAADSAQNKWNSTVRRDSRSGLKGAFFVSRKGCWTSEIKVRGQRHHLGYFSSAVAAHQAYATAAAELHGLFARAS